MGPLAAAGTSALTILQQGIILNLCDFLAQVKQASVFNNMTVGKWADQALKTHVG